MSDMRAKALTPEELVAMYAATIYRIAYARLHNATDAEDVTQEVLIKYIKADKTFQDEDHRRMWLIRVTVNTVNSLVSSAYRRHAAPLEEACGITDLPEDEELSWIRDAVMRLPDKYRVPVHLFYYEDMTIKQIASVLNCAEGTVKSLLSRGRDRLKVLLEENAYV